MGKDNTNIQLQQEQKLKEIGAFLAQTRIEKGISLETIANQTHIQLRLLTAIEAGNQEDLPEPFYTQALIKKYAHALKVTVELEEYIQPKSISTSHSEKRISLPRFQFPKLEIRSVHLYLLYILVVGMSVKGITYLVGQSTQQVSDKKITSPVETVIPINNSSSPNEQLESSSKIISKPDKSKSVVVDLILKDRCWLKVIVDGKTEFEGILPKGTHRNWVGNQQVTVRAGNAGGVFITANDEQEGLLGEPGEVQEVTYKVN
jgi:cytoskeletal protein RodZ